MARGTNLSDGSTDWALAWAYIVGRNLQYVRIWQRALYEIASTAGRPWNSLHGYKLFVDSCVQPPINDFVEIDDALRELAFGGIVDAAVLVELHRSLDVLSDTCDEWAQLAGDDDRETINELYWSSDDIWDSTVRLMDRCLVNANVDQYRRLGDQLGELALQVVEGSGPDKFHPELKSLIELAKRLFGEEPLFELEDMEQELAEVAAQTTAVATTEFDDDVLQLLVGLDMSIMDTLAGDDGGEPDVILDDASGLLDFCGHKFLFDEFKESRARCGLAIFRVLVQNPGASMSASDLLERAGLGADVKRVAEYLSGFRGVLEAALDDVASGLQDEGQRKLAQRAFIRPDSAARKRDPNNEPHYRLELSRRLVSYTPPR